MSRTYNAERKALATNKTKPSDYESTEALLDDARAQIKRGAPPAAVVKRLEEHGIGAAGL